jgi:multidrug efflux system outer membrane protein
MLAPAILIAALASSCTLMPRYQRPAAPIAAQYPGAAAVASTIAARPLASDILWRDFIGDIRLRRLIELALDNNRDLRVAMLNVEQSQAQYRATRASMFPALDATGSYSASRSSSVSIPGFASVPGFGALPAIITHEWSAGVGLSSYELDFFGRLRSLNQQALEQYLASEQARRNARISLIAEVATQYFALREAQEQLRVANDTLRAVQASYELNDITFQAGETNELDLRTAEGQVQSAKVDVATYERQQAQALDDLVLLLGVPLPPNLPAPQRFDSPGLLAEVPAGAPSDLVARRPDILEAEDTLKAANANIGAARAAFFPAITLTSSLGTGSTQLYGLFGPGNGTWNFAPQLTLPIFTGGKNRANLDIAQLMRRIDIANYEKAIQTAFRQVADALTADRTYAQQIEAQADAIQAQQRRLELATLRYRQGEDTYLNVLLAQQDLYTAQQGRLEAQFNRLSSQIALYQSLGGGWQ